jgi:hypothetical protein
MKQNKRYWKTKKTEARADKKEKRKECGRKTRPFVH